MNESRSESSLLNEWREFVVQVERGYIDYLEEYDNDQLVRLSIEELLKNSSFVGDSFSEEVSKWDDRLMNATRERKGGVYDLPIMNRIPLRLDGNLKEDVEALEL